MPRAAEAAKSISRDQVPPEKSEAPYYSRRHGNVLRLREEVRGRGSQVQRDLKK
jgi:hypothetical protein